MSPRWDPPPSEAAAELIRRAAQLFLDAPAELVEQLDRAVFAASVEPMRVEPTLADEVTASTRANIVHWATCTAADPYSRVPANLSPEVLGIARDAVRRGAEQTLLSTYHAGQNVAWRYCMQIAFAMTQDVEELRDVLDLAARSIFAFVDDTLAALQEQIELERKELTRGSHAERFEIANLVIEGAPISTERATARLRHDLTRDHVAALLWSDPRTADHGELGRAAEALARAADAPAPLTVIASSASLWVWLATATDPDPARVREALGATPGVRAAVGPVGHGIDGFRSSHLDAVATQRLMLQLSGELQVASYADVAMVALVAHDEERAGEFAARTLGDLANADPELRHTLQTYIREEFSASAAARALFAHRNTVLNRLARAEKLLPAPLEGRGLEVGLALEIVQWLGTPGARG